MKDRIRGAVYVSLFFSVIQYTQMSGSNASGGRRLESRRLGFGRGSKQISIYILYPAGKVSLAGFANMKILTEKYLFLTGNKKHKVIINSIY